MLCWLRKKKLFEYAIGELDTNQVQKIEKHLKSCHRCQDYMSAVQKINGLNSCDEQPFLNEVFWRKFDERLDLNITGGRKTPANLMTGKIKLYAWPLPRFAIGAAVAICVFLVVITGTKNIPFSKTTIALEDEDLIETVLLIEGDAELNLNGDEDAYIEEILLQIALSEA